MEPLVYFVAMMLSLALVHSMLYNSRRLEALGYALSVLFFQQLIAGNEDIFLICPQFPVYVSPKDQDLNPNKTMADSTARGVYVDLALLLPRATPIGDLRKYHLVDIFRRGFGNCNLYRTLNITSLEAPILEEKKRPSTRHPRNVQDHVSSIEDCLEAARKQVTTQAEVLFSSPRFATQELVVLIASSGEYYRLAVLSRRHPVLSALPSRLKVFKILDSQDEEIDEDLILEDLKVELVLSAKTPTEREAQRNRMKQKADDAERVKQNSARDERYEARRRMKAAMAKETGLKNLLSTIIVNAGDPPYSDDSMEQYWSVNQNFKQGGECFRRHPTFFEPEPQPNENLYSFADVLNPDNSREVVFTCVIRVGSKISNIFCYMIQQHLSKVAHDERLRRKGAFGHY